MNYAQLKAFHAVAGHGSFTRAAAALHVTQPTLSDHVRALESHYGVRLFERRGKGVVLTGLGEALLNITRRQFNLEAEAEQLLSGAHGLKGGTLRVAADGPYLILPLLGSFHRRYPDIKLSIRFGNSKQVLEELFQRRSDIALLPEIGEDERVYARPLREDRLVLLVPAGHAWSGRRTLQVAELAGQRLLVRETGSNTRAVFEQALADARVIPAEMLEIGSREGVREAVAANLGIGVIAESEIGVDDRLHALRIRDARVKVVASLVCLQASRRSDVLKTFFDFIDEEA